MKTSLAQEQFVQAHPKSQALAQRARDLFPDGVTHDGRMFAPFPMYIDRLQGAKKWCVDGHEYVCYVTGHGASILGHSHPEVVEAVQRQVALGSHASGSSAQEIELAELILKLFPSAEKLRFTNSGTEANMMAVRLARAATGRPKLVKLQGNFPTAGPTPFSLVSTRPSRCRRPDCPRASTKALSPSQLTTFKLSKMPSPTATSLPS